MPFLPFRRNQKQKSSAEKLAGKKYLFFVYRVTPYSEGIPNSIDFYKRISWYIIYVCL